MNNNFARIITLLRKERGYSQKKVAEDLGISQALLSHYEKGIRECGLDFVVKVADYYDVSCDYLLGRTPHRSGATISVEDIPEPDSAGKENVMHGNSGSLLPVLNKKLIANSLNIIYGTLQKCSSKALTAEISAYLNLAVYKVFRMLYSANPKNPQGLFFRFAETGCGPVQRRAGNCAEQCRHAFWRVKKWKTLIPFRKVWRPLCLPKRSTKSIRCLRRRFST